MFNTVKALFVFLMIQMSQVQAETVTESGKMIGGQASDLPAWFKDSFLEIEEDIIEASESGKHVMLYMHLSGCPYCYKMIEEGFKLEPNRSLLKEGFDIVDINIKGGKDVMLNEDTEMLESELARHFEVMFTPTMVFLDENGKLVYKISGFRSAKNVEYVLEYIKNKIYLNNSLSGYIKEKSRQEVYKFKNHDSFVDDKDLSKFNDGGMMVVFEDKYCDLCDKYHGGLFSDGDVKNMMDKFAVVRLNAESNERIILPNGDVSTPAKWVNELELEYRPGIVLFSRGEEKIKITGMLYKYHFVELLRYVGDKLFDEYPNSFYDYLRVRTEELIKGGATIDISDTMDAIIHTKK